MEDEYTKLQKLFVALQKPHRECLYDLSNPDYKNNNKKQIVWAQIAEEMAMSKNNVQSLWKRIKIKYRAALGKENAPSGSGRIPLRPMESFLMKEMDFLRPYLEDDEPRTCNTTAHSKSFQGLFDDFATELDEEGSSIAATTPSPVPKKKHKVNLETSLLQSLEKIGDMQSNLKRKEKDPFYSYLESIIDKLPPEKKRKSKKKYNKNGIGGIN